MIPLETLADRLGLASAAGAWQDRVISGAYCSDMLSDVIANARAGDVLITILTNRNVIGVAVLVGLAAVIITGGRLPEESAVEAAKRENIPVFTTIMNNFEAAGRVYQLLHRQ